LLMKLHVDIDIDADEAMSPVGMQLRWTLATEIDRW
jgi:hypothetical protein